MRMGVVMASMAMAVAVPVFMGRTVLVLVSMLVHPHVFYVYPQRFTSRFCRCVSSMALVLLAPAIPTVHVH